MLLRKHRSKSKLNTLSREVLLFPICTFRHAYFHIEVTLVNDLLRKSVIFRGQYSEASLSPTFTLNALHATIHILFVLVSMSAVWLRGVYLLPTKHTLRTRCWVAKMHFLKLGVQKLWKICSPRYLRVREVAIIFLNELHKVNQHFAKTFRNV